MKHIPLFDLQRDHKKIKSEVFSCWEKIYDQNSFTGGVETEKFEKNFANYCKTKYAVAVHSGTDSLILSLKAMELQPGDEVITTPCTFTATVDAIIHSGAIPVFADVDEETGNIDPEEIKKKITPQTRVILLVHLYGVACKMDDIVEIAKKYKIEIIEDCSHAHGTQYKHKKVGSFGLAGCFSLYPSKSLGSVGNAGIITSNNYHFIKKVRSLANHGITSRKNKYIHYYSGYNKLIDNIQSAVLNIKLKNLDSIIKKKYEIAKKYNNAFKKNGLDGMSFYAGVQPSIYVFAYQSKNREKDARHFHRNNIQTGIYYPIPIHLQPSMKKLGYKKGDFPRAESFFDATLSIPCYAELTNEEKTHIISVIKTL